MAKSFFGPTALGIDIGDDHLKLALLSQGLTRKVTLLGLLAQPLDSGVVVKGIIQNPVAIQQTIIQGLKRFRLNLEDVVASISVPQEKVYITTIPTERGLTPADLSLIAEEHFPIQAKEAEIRTTQLFGENKQWTVIAAVDKLSVNRLIQTCDAVGLHVGAVEFDSLALARLLRFESVWPDFLFILDIGATHATLTAFNSGSGIFREYNLKSISGEIITQKIAEALHLETTQAEALKRMYGLEFSAAQKVPVDQAMQDLSLSISKEINSILGFLASHQGLNMPLEVPLVLVGGGAQTLGLTEQLSMVLNRRVLTWKPDNRFKLIPKMPSTAYAAFAVSIGTAIRILQYE